MNARELGVESLLDSHGAGHGAADHDVMTLTIVQIATGALVALCFALALEPMPDVSVFTPDFLAALAYLVILASCVAMVVQNFGQSKVPPAQAALLLSMNPQAGSSM